MRKVQLLDSLDDFTRGYLECAVWSSTRDDGEPLDRDFGVEDLTVAALREARRECAGFQSDNAELLELYCEEIAFDPSKGSPEEYAGHDFWLTRNGHGAGFWDRGLAETGMQLSEAAEAYGGRDLYAHRGRLHFT